MRILLVLLILCCSGCLEQFSENRPRPRRSWYEWGHERRHPIHNWLRSEDDGDGEASGDLSPLATELNEAVKGDKHQVKKLVDLMDGFAELIDSPDVTNTRTLVNAEREGRKLLKAETNEKLKVIADREFACFLPEREMSKTDKKDGHAAFRKVADAGREILK